MSWDSEIPTIIRYMINDVSATPTYSDDRLAITGLVAALQVQQDAKFPILYSVSIENVRMSPDCTIGTNRNESFINLVCLKASFIVVTNEIKLYSSQGVRIRDGSSEVDLKRDAKGLRLLRDIYKQEYDNAVFLYKMGQTSVGEAVVGPFKLDYSVDLVGTFPTYSDENRSGYRWW